MEIIQQVKEVDKAISGTVKTGQFTIVDYSQQLLERMQNEGVA